MGSATEGQRRGVGLLPTSSPVSARSESGTKMGHLGSVGPSSRLRGATRLPKPRSSRSKTRGKASPPVQRSRRVGARSPTRGGTPRRGPRSMHAARRGKLRKRRIGCRRSSSSSELRRAAATTRLPAGSCLRFAVPPWRTPPCSLWEMRRNPTGRRQCPPAGRPRAGTSYPFASLPCSPTLSRHGRSGRRRRRPPRPVSRWRRAAGRLSLGRSRRRRRCPRRNGHHPSHPLARRLHGAR